MSFATDQSVLHYRILEKLGEGGMGEVWLAQDSKLDRKVALKVLPEKMAADPERRQRFEREAKAIAALNHPNIVTVFAVEEWEGLHFLAMELVEGDSLGSLIPAGGLDLKRIFELAIPMADALSAAHERGITHRDLKPDNVMIGADGRVKILDFGLAKWADHTLATDDGIEMATATVTQEGKILGTVAYMSPEQAQGKPVDARSDVFSLGILLYEMTTGQRPFRGDNAISTLSSILKDSPPSLTDLKTELPTHLDRVVKRCLAKDPERRYQSAKELRNELEQLKDEIVSQELSGVRDAVPAGGSKKTGWILGAVAVLAIAAVLVFLGPRWFSGGGESSTAANVTTDERKMIVVLPFENLGQAEDEYFAAGITDEITNRLAAVESLGVISRKSALHYAGGGKSTREIGDELDVDFILEGTVRWARSGDGGSRVRISPRLIRVQDDTQLWGDTYEEVMDDIFQVQSDIAGQTVSQLGLTLGASGRQALEAKPTDNLEAYQSFLRGNYLFDSPNWTRDSYLLSADAYRRAVELDPQFATAWARLSSTHAMLYHLGYDVSEQRRLLAREALDEAARLAPESAETYLARGYYHYWGYKEYEQALEQFDLAGERLADPSEALEGKAFVLRRMGRYAEVVDTLEQLAKNNPRDSGMALNIGETLMYEGRYEEAIRWADISITLQPVENWASFHKAQAIWNLKGSAGLAEARQVLEAAAVPATDSFSRYYWFSQLLREGRTDEAIVHLNKDPDGAWVRLTDLAYPRSLLIGLALAGDGRDEQARAEFAEAVPILEAEIAESLEDYRLVSALGIAYAGAGRSREGITTARRGVTMLPPERDMLLGSQRVMELAMADRLTGDMAAAAAELNRLLGLSKFEGPKNLAMLPFWEPVLNHPDFKY
ncbi:MAG: protein kinase [Acidobacteria bacterium]|uniref:non-specific serine/threonine protein kinase n=1 Tax=Candidatus Polarisedimenticola svalbardensis TaxID=2886004 RepID=A0A8J6Y6X2_9BACT|nr:protein kinase [Candidatus Polarisedimenticola svalbardensis]